MFESFSEFQIGKGSKKPSKEHDKRKEYEAKIEKIVEQDDEDEEYGEDADVSIIPSSVHTYE